MPVVSRITVDTVSWTPIVMVGEPADVYLENADPDVAWEFRTTQTSSATQRSVAAGIGLKLKGGSRALIGFVQVISGTGPMVLTETPK